MKQHISSRELNTNFAIEYLFVKKIVPKQLRKYEVCIY